MGRAVAFNLRLMKPLHLKNMSKTLFATTIMCGPRSIINYYNVAVAKKWTLV